jgi:hypothetical protein
LAIVEKDIQRYVMARAPKHLPLLSGMLTCRRTILPCVGGRRRLALAEPFLVTTVFSWLRAEERAAQQIRSKILAPASTVIWTVLVACGAVGGFYGSTGYSFLVLVAAQEEPERHLLFLIMSCNGIIKHQDESDHHCPKEKKTI